MAGKTGRFKILEQFIADGMTVMFGNPGTVEQGFLDALDAYPAMRYILTLQESVTVLAADGYARATRHPTLVQLHSAPGIGNAVGALYQAKRGHAPLVVIGGDAGLRYMNMDAQMAGDLVAMMAPVTKYATMVLDPRSLLRTLRRAIKIAATPPMGPVYVCLPADVLDQVNEEPVFPSCVPATRVLPPADTLERMAVGLRDAERPVLFIGDGVATSEAQAETARIAELLGAPVYGADIGEVCMDTTHPCWHGTTGHMFGAQSLPITRSGDANLIVGTYMVPEVFPELGDIFAPGAAVFHIDLNGYEIAKNHRVDLGVTADPKLTLAALADLLEKTMSPARKGAAADRVKRFAAEKRERTEKEKAEDRRHDGATPLHMAQFMRILAGKLPPDAVIFDEALTSGPEVTRYLPPRMAGSYFVTRGGSLGVGFPGAIGAKIADPARTVIGFSGDGGSMYTIQALWSAVRHRIGAKFVVCNNGSYRLLQLNILQYWKDNGIASHDMPLSFDLSEPRIDFAALARSLGVAAVRVEKEADIAPAVEQMLADDRPFLIDLLLEGNIHPERIGVKCGQ